MIMEKRNTNRSDSSGSRERGSAGFGADGGGVGTNLDREVDERRKRRNSRDQLPQAAKLLNRHVRRGRTLRAFESAEIMYFTCISSGEFETSV